MFASFAVEFSSLYFNLSLIFCVGLFFFFNVPQRFSGFVSIDDAAGASAVTPSVFTRRIEPGLFDRRCSECIVYYPNERGATMERSSLSSKFVQEKYTKLDNEIKNRHRERTSHRTGGRSKSDSGHQVFS